MPFEVFTRRLAPLGKTPTFTIQKRGTLSLNRSAYALLGEPAAVELLYDRDEHVVGMRPVEADEPHAYPFRPLSKQRDDEEDRGPVVVAGTAFTQYYRIDTTVSRRWVPEMRDGVLCIDLKQEGVVATSNRSRGDTAN